MKHIDYRNETDIETRLDMWLELAKCALPMLASRKTQPNAAMAFISGVLASRIIGRHDVPRSPGLSDEVWKLCAKCSLSEFTVLPDGTLVRGEQQTGDHIVLTTYHDIPKMFQGLSDAANKRKAFEERLTELSEMFIALFFNHLAYSHETCTYTSVPRRNKLFCICGPINSSVPGWKDSVIDMLNKRTETRSV